MSDLRERVARLVYGLATETAFSEHDQCDPYWDGDREGCRKNCRDYADAVIALVLEEAAKVVEGLSKFDYDSLAADYMQEKAAAAIRELKTKTAEPSTTQSP